MTDLPASIEAALLDAGFSGTEVIVIKKLLQEDTLTLRELAAKTGKSTGVLDQAVKKLLKKGIISREVINEAPKYLLKSLDVVLKWMEEDTKMKQDMMVRRQQNFETFIRTIVATQSTGRRPEMEYFEGRDGVKKAYMQILNRGNDIAMYGPTLYLAEEDPLRDLKVQWFRERQRRGIFLRVITDDTVLGRRSQSRDPFEYRKTILVDPERYALQFERMIAGDTIACFQPEMDRAVFVRYPEYAEAERVFFERLWNKKIQYEANSNAAQNEGGSSKPPLDVITIPMKTKTLSSLREFFLSKRSIAALAICTVLAAAGTYGFYEYNLQLSIKRIQDRVLAIAATGALQFNPADLNELRTPADITKPQYAKVISLLNSIRSENKGVAYAYILRPDNPEKATSFVVADADSLDPNAKKDINLDGKIDEHDQITLPGYLSNDTGSIPPIYEGYKRPMAFEPFYDKQWGTVISGLAPIKDANGTTVAALEIDVFLNQVMEITGVTYTPSLIFISLLVIFIIIRLLAFNRSLLKELQQSLQQRSKLITACCGAIIATIASGVIYHHGIVQSVADARARIETIATTGSLQFNANDLDQLRSLEDIKKPIYSEVVGKLHNIRAGNNQIKYVYLIRPDLNSTMFEFIADADAYNINPVAKNDINGDGISDASDEVGYPGRPYDVSDIPILTKEMFFIPTSMEAPYTDQWGTVFTGYAPIKTESGVVTSLLAVDVDASFIHSFHPIILLPFGVYVAILLFYLLCWSPNIKASLFYELLKQFALGRT